MSYESAARQQLRRKWWLRAVGILACIVVFITVYALVLPAITMEGTPTCGLEEHTHDAECYDAEGVLICTLEEHVHDAACYAEDDTELAEPEPDAEEPAAEPDAEPADAEPADAAKETDDVEDEEPVLAAPVLRAPLLGAGGSSSIAPPGKVEAANEWQIVSGEYVGNNPSNKVESADNRVRVQKNVIATDNENEFLIYMSIDINRETVLQEIFETVGLVVTPSNDAKDPGTVLSGSSRSKAENAWNTGADDGNMRVLKMESSPGYTNKWTITFVTDDGPVTITRYASGNSYSNGHFVMRINGTWLVVGDASKGAGSSNVEITITGEILKEILELATYVDTGSVVDTMGANIIATEMISATGSATISEDGKTINWTPNSSTSSETESGWYENVAEMMYRIRYVPEISTGLISDSNNVADYDDAVLNTNGSAYLNYKVTDEGAGASTTNTQYFPNPEIRGMLYAVKAVKVDNSGNKLPDASFAIYSDPECTNKVAETSSDEDGVISFAGLQFGTYYIKETEAPSGYKVDDTAQSVRLCYTDSKDALTGQGAGKDALYDGTVDATKIEFVNEQIQPTIILVKQDFSGNLLNGAEFTVTGPNEFSISGVSSEDGSENYSKILVIEKAKPGEYNVKETKAPVGYEPADDFVITVPSDGSDVTATPGSKSVSKIDKLDNDDGSHTYIIYIVNNPGIELPATGGMGTVVFTVSGLTLMATAMILLSKQRKRYDA